MKKRYLALVLGLILALCLLFLTACGEEDSSTASTGLAYYLLGDGTYEVYGIGSCTDKDIVIPSKYKGKPVTSIGDYSFDGCTSLKSITIPDSVKSIGGKAFSGCTSLRQVRISDLSAWCKIQFGDEYSNPLFLAHNLYLNGTLVTDLVIPDSVTSIGEDAFRGCTGLTSITIPDSVTSIGKNAFEFCSSLTSITIPDSVTSIGLWAFSGCTSLTDVYFTGTMAQWKKISIESDNTYLTSATIHCTDGTIN